MNKSSIGIEVCYIVQLVYHTSHGLQSCNKKNTVKMLKRGFRCFKRNKQDIMQYFSTPVVRFLLQLTTTTYAAKKIFCSPMSQKYVPPNLTITFQFKSSLVPSRLKDYREGH